MLTEDGVDSSLVGESAVDTTLMFSGDDFDEDDEEIEFYDEKDKVALILDPQNYETWESRQVSSRPGFRFKPPAPPPQS